MSDMILPDSTPQRHATTIPGIKLSHHVFCLMLRIFHLMLVLLYIYINSINIPPNMIINRIYETQNLLSL
jgi:hypothetical protein